MGENAYDFGIVGLGTMGRSLLLNVADHGFGVAGLERDEEKAAALQAEAGDRAVGVTTDPRQFVASIRGPRAILMLVPAGQPVDDVIANVSPLLIRGDILIDGGNSFYKDTARRAAQLSSKGIEYIGMGVSGGESGARHGPSMMAGGNRPAYERVRLILEAVSAKFEGEPCVDLVGPGPSGHYVKMVHNGIEYGLMQLIAESYDLLRRACGFSNGECQETFARWNQGELSSYLIEITATVLARKDGDAYLVDLISDRAKQKGTGKWTSQDAMDLGTPIPTIDAAVTAREISSLQAERQEVAFRRDHKASSPHTLAAHLEDALYTATLVTYAQGFAQLASASAEYNFNLDLEACARVWRAGCIIRSRSLETIRAILEASPTPNLLLDEGFRATVERGENSLREVAKAAIDAAIPAPCLQASLAYLDAYRTERLPANLIQAQRDYFGAHGYERTDREGSFHTPDWEVQA